ncbi:MAG TPA: DUF4365 domain-containing protein, partial [Segetibacter sp.]
MNHFKTERKAIYETAKFFTECGWIFREQSIIDLGIDAYVETPIDANGQVKIFALQIKGGESNFHKKKNSIAFYFSERHYLYWNAISDNHPLFIILQDPVIDRIYWQYYNPYSISKTPKNWKLDVPYHNVLNASSKDKISEILYGYKRFKLSTTFNPYLSQQNKDDVTIKFFINSEINSSLHIYLKYKNESVSIDLGYKPKKKDWDFAKSFLTWENQYHYSLIDFEKYIRSQFCVTNNHKQFFKKLADQIRLISKGQIGSVAEFMFNYENNENDVPKYEEFLKAFELYSKLRRGQYEAHVLGSIVHFKTKKGTFEMSTYQSLTEQLKSYIENRSYDEIYTETREDIWGYIYLDAGIEKSKFIPVMQNEWERYWERLYSRIKEEIGHTDHLDKSREESWRMFKSFFHLYNDAENIIELAYDFDDMVLYPLAVITMMKIFDPEVCYDEYCELEFDTGNEWESISLDDEN